MSDALAEIVVVIVTYRSAGLVADAITTLPLEQIGGVVVVDNASDDGTAAVVRELVGGSVRLVEHPNNVGFGAGNNVGVRNAAPSRWVLFLNPDARIDGENLLELVHYARRTPRAAIVGPRLSNGEQVIASAGRAASLFTEVRALLPGFVARWMPDRRLPAGYAASGPVGYVEGACMLIDREGLDEIGGFDERFFLFFEELDLAQRFASIGRETHLCSTAHAVHQVGRSRETVAFGAHPELITSTMRYFRKWKPRRVAVAYASTARLIWRTNQLLHRATPDQLAVRREALRRGYGDVPAPR